MHQILLPTGSLENERLKHSVNVVDQGFFLATRLSSKNEIRAHIQSVAMQNMALLHEMVRLAMHGRGIVKEIRLQPTEFKRCLRRAYRCVAISRIKFRIYTLRQHLPMQRHRAGTQAAAAQRFK